MKRLLMTCALAGFVLACGDDDGGDKPAPVDGGKTDAGLDSGKPDSGPGADSAVAAKVTNVGSTCTVANQATACTGAAAICQVTTLGMATVPGGSCSAVCSSNEECGTGGICPTGIAIKNFGAQAIASLGPTGYCNKSCVKGTTTCGTGFSCLTLNDLSKLQGKPTTMIAPLDDPFCFPTPVAPGDGGVSDAGTVSSVDGGIDGGR